MSPIVCLLEIKVKVWQTKKSEAKKKISVRLDWKKFDWVRRPRWLFVFLPSLETKDRRLVCSFSSKYKDNARCVRIVVLKTIFIESKLRKEEDPNVIGFVERKWNLFVEPTKFRSFKRFQRFVDRLERCGKKKKDKKRVTCKVSTWILFFSSSFFFRRFSEFVFSLFVFIIWLFDDVSPMIWTTEICRWASLRKTALHRWRTRKTIRTFKRRRSKTKTRKTEKRRQRSPKTETSIRVNYVCCNTKIIRIFFNWIRREKVQILSVCQSLFLENKIKISFCNLMKKNKTTLLSSDERVFYFLGIQMKTRTFFPLLPNFLPHRTSL